MQMPVSFFIYQKLVTFLTHTRSHKTVIVNPFFYG